MGRGVEKRNVVLDNRDRARFIHDLFVFNDRGPAQHPHQSDRRDERIRRDLLVSLHAFCLMKNHYHLLVSEAAPGGISLFMKKLNGGYTKYFNERHRRSGGLWQGKYKKILVKRDAHFLYLPYYIHLNPLDYVMPEWRMGNVKDARKALEHLEEYRWSSHVDYLGVRNFPSVISQKDLGPMLGSRRSYEREIGRIIGDPSLAGRSCSSEYED